MRSQQPGSIRSIAAKLGISPTLVYRILHGTASPESIMAYGPLVNALRQGNGTHDAAPSATAAATPRGHATTRHPPAAVDTALTPAQAARLLQLSTRTVYRLCRRGLIPHARIGRLYRISPQAVRWILASRGAIPIQMAQTTGLLPPRPEGVPPSARKRGEGR
ncbi:hypothetical protein HRbin24_00017 [bacterium HR24]|jgi:excisionase family DNA binding protein|nr:helix-turn-helix domain-containing protein [Chloroflexota bacterium]GBD12017.1 hypothetical protein HRbin24_00017 [bacterium HR24]